MPIGSALVDKARVVERTAAGARVEGRTLRGETRGPWFRCRLTLPTSPEQAAAAAGIREVVRVPTLLYDTIDESGEPVVLTNQKRLEVASPELGTVVWDVSSDPEPLRKKRRVIGFQTTLRRLETHPADES